MMDPEMERMVRALCENIARHPLGPQLIDVMPKFREPTREKMIEALRNGIAAQRPGYELVMSLDRTYAERIDPWRELRGTIGPWGSTVQRSSAWFTHDRVTMDATEFLFWLEAP